MPDYKGKTFLILPPIPTILGAEIDEVDRRVRREDQKRVINYVLPYSDGILVGGTTGHGPALTDNQFASPLRIALEIKRSTFSDKCLLVGAIEASDGRAKEKIYKAIQIEKEVGEGIDGFVVAPQSFFYKKSFPEIYRSIKEIAEYAQRFEKVIYLYNIPRAGSVLNSKNIEEIKEIDNVKGVKDSCGDYNLFKELLRLQDEEFGVYQGKPQFDLKVMEEEALLMPMLILPRGW